MREEALCLFDGTTFDASYRVGIILHHADLFSPATDTNFAENHTMHQLILLITAWHSVAWKRLHIIMIVIKYYHCNPPRSRYI